MEDWPAGRGVGLRTQHHQKGRRSFDAVSCSVACRYSRLVGRPRLNATCLAVLVFLVSPWRLLVLSPVGGHRGGTQIPGVSPRVGIQHRRLGVPDIHCSRRAVRQTALAIRLDRRSAEVPGAGTGYLRPTLS